MSVIQNNTKFYISLHEFRTIPSLINLPNDDSDYKTVLKVGNLSCKLLLLCQLKPNERQSWFMNTYNIIRIQEYLACKYITNVIIYLTIIIIAILSVIYKSGIIIIVRPIIIKNIQTEGLWNTWQLQGTYRSTHQSPACSIAQLKKKDEVTKKK